MRRLHIVLTGLPVRGKSLMAARLREGLEADGLKVEIFNNGTLRRMRLGPESSLPEFYNPANKHARKQSEDLARINMELAREFLDQGGEAAILDAVNGSPARRQTIGAVLTNAPVLFIECVNNDPELLETSIERKAQLPEFAGLSRAEAVQSFKQRLAYYEQTYTSLRDEPSFVRVETLYNRILEERACDHVPFYIQIRDILVSDWVRNLYLLRHGQSEDNVQDRIGGDSGLTDQGRRQSEALTEYFRNFDIPCIFTSSRRRSRETAAPLLEAHPRSIHIMIPEFDEIDAGVCEGMTYKEISLRMPHEYAARQADKYAYIYPKGEGYCTLGERVARGFRKALFLSGAAPGILIIGHQAINRMILSLFFFRRNESVPYIYVPQNEYFHIISTHRKTLLELVPFARAS